MLEENEKELLDSDQAAAYCGLQPVTVRRAALEGKLKSVIVHVAGARHERRYRKGDLDEWRRATKRDMGKPKRSELPGRTERITAHA